MITVAQVGLGAWGQNHLRAFFKLKDCRLKICCDRSKEILDKVQTFCGPETRLTEDFNDILEDKEISAVVIATPPATHAELTIKALSAGKNVFVEKPLALKVEDGVQMVAAAKKADKKFRGLDNFDGTNLLSLSLLKKIIRCYYGRNYKIFFLPKSLKSTARNTPLRRIVRNILAVPLAGDLFSLLINKMLLFFMPYQIALCFKLEEIRCDVD